MAMRPCYRPCIVIFLLFLLSCILTLQAQESGRRITLRSSGILLGDALSEISRQTGIMFSYNPGEIPLQRKVTVDFVNIPVNDALKQLLIPLGIEFRHVENQVVLRKIKSAGSNSEPVVSPRSFAVSGFLYDGASGEALIGANVSVKGTSRGTTTNGYGYYSLSLPAGRSTLLFSYIGFQTREMEVDMKENLRISTELIETSTEMEEVEVTADEENPVTLTRQMSGISLPRSALARLPGFGGDMDVIRALQVIPGIHTYGDGSSLYFVRGGNSDQNLLLIDEVPVYNPSHLFGFFSAFSPDAINSVDVYKGDFPSRYGGRLSSVIDIKAREGNMKRFGMAGNIGPYASNLTVEGPLARDKASFILSGRVSTLGWLNEIQPFNADFGFSFFDINGKVNWKINRNNRVYLTIYYGRDDFSRFNTVQVNSYGIGWNNMAATLRWNHLAGSRLFINTTVNYSRYNYSLNLPQETNGYWNSTVSNVTAKSDGTWYANANNTVRAGWEVTYHHSNPGNVTLPDGAANTEIPEVAEYHSMEYLLYLSNEQSVGRRLSFRYGIRLPVWMDIGPTRVSYFDANYQVIDTIAYNAGEAYSTAFSPEPRLNIQYLLSESSSLKASYTRNTQFLQVLSNSTGPFTSLEVWAPCGPNIAPQVADQVAMGYSGILKGGMISVSAEGWYKWFRNRIDYRDHANLLFNTLIEGELRFGKANAYGLELMLRKNKGRFTGSVGYTFSRALVTTPGVNGDETYPASYDRPHEICVNLVWEDKKRWTVTAAWIYMTGNPVTTPTGFYIYNGYQVPFYGERNNSRLPDYHRLDLSVKFRLNRESRRYNHSVAVTVYNAYGRWNPFSYSYNKIRDNDGNFVVPSDIPGTVNLVPTSISVAGVIPSVNYIFRF